MTIDSGREVYLLVMAVDKLVVVVLDSLKRDWLGAYGSSRGATPVLDRFAAESIVFDRHHVGSLPCMPARHDILVGALDFPWRPWGSIEIWEDAVTRDLRRESVITMLVSDHPHLFEVGGENYHVDFTAWRYERGHESDPWRTRPDPTWIGTPAPPVDSHPRGRFQYEDSRTWFRSEADFPGPRTMAAAADWIRDESCRDGRWFLFVDEFDPHEPFDTPEPWASMFRDRDDDPRTIWPPYVVGGRARGVVSEADARSLVAAYTAKVAMIDHWFGRVLAAIDESGQADDTAVIVTTDHGHYLGEHDVWGKPGHPIMDALGHIPLMVRWPGGAARRSEALTTSVDLHATILDVFGARTDHRTHGRSLVPLIEARTSSVRDCVLAGYWGREVLLVTHDWNYVRGSRGRGYPLSMWSNRWSTMPVHGRPDLRLPRPDSRARLDRMPGSDVPVIRQPFEPGDLLPFWAHGGLVDEDRLFSRVDDREQRHDRSGDVGSAAVLDQLTDHLRDELRVLEVPDDLLTRLALA